MASATGNIIQLDNSKCRICLFAKHNLCPLFRRGLSMKVMKLADIKMYEGDGLPSSICLDCELEVKRCTNFIAQIQRADEKWREIWRAKEKELCGIHEKHEELSVRLPEKEEPYQVASTSQVRRPNTTIAFLIRKVPAKSKSSKIKPVLNIIRKRNTGCLNISAGEPIGNEDKCQPQEPLPNTMLISPIEPNESEDKGSLCTTEINEHAELETHFQNRYNYNCGKCSESFLTKTNFVLHWREKHSSDLYKCNMCNKTYKRYGDLRKHKFVVHKCSNISLECVVCKKTFSNLSLLKHHQKFFHIAYENMVCELCNSTCLGPYRMKTHMKDIHKNVPATCETCGKVYSCVKYLNQHQEIMHDKSEQLCRVCGKSFQGKLSLKHHMNLEHSKKDVFPCKLCNETFSDQSLLTDHKIKLHRKQAIPKPAFCEICGKLFKRAEILNKHKLVHSDERHFICDICGAAFKQKAGLVMHQRVHSTVGKYFCDHCNKSFRWQQVFAKHVKNCDMREKNGQNQ